MKREDLIKKYDELDEITQCRIELNQVMYLFSELLNTLAEKYKIRNELLDLLEKYSTANYNSILDPNYKGGLAETRDYKNQILELIKKAK